jgi:hypothetical protein
MTEPKLRLEKPRSVASAVRRFHLARQQLAESLAAAGLTAKLFTDLKKPSGFEGLANDDPKEGA